MSSAVAKAAKRGILSSLQGPRPLPLSVPGTTSPPPRPAKRPRVVVNGEDDDDVRAPPATRGPVIVYEQTPKVIHARPDEFKALVQRLTGPRAAGDQPSSSQQVVVEDPLVLTLGQQQVPLPAPLLLDDHLHPTPPELPSSPGGAGAGAGFLLSPGRFLFSPATMQAIHELIS